VFYGNEINENVSYFDSNGDRNHLKNVAYPKSLKIRKNFKNKKNEEHNYLLNGAKYDIILLYSQCTNYFGTYF
jgi:hypothetical protein